MWVISTHKKKLTSSDFDEVLEIYLFKYCQGGRIFHAVGIIQIAITWL